MQEGESYNNKQNDTKAFRRHNRMKPQMKESSLGLIPLTVICTVQINGLAFIGWIIIYSVRVRQCLTSPLLRGVWLVPTSRLLYSRWYKHHTQVWMWTQLSIPLWWMRKGVIVKPHDDQISHFTRNIHSFSRVTVHSSQKCPNGLLPPLCLRALPPFSLDSNWNVATLHSVLVFSFLINHGFLSQWPTLSWFLL